MKPIVLTRHAADSMVERKLGMAWIEAAARRPDWRKPDPSDPEVERRYLLLPELDGRVLRLARVEDEATIRVGTAFLDRGARRRQ
jgi:hypothetical protein